MANLYKSYRRQAIFWNFLHDSSFLADYEGSFAENDSRAKLLLVNIIVEHCKVNMSSIIDEDAFQLCLDNQVSPPTEPAFGFPTFSTISIKGEDDWLLLKRREGWFQIVKKIVFNNEEYLVKINAGNKTIKIIAILLNGSNFYRCHSLPI